MNKFLTRLFYLMVLLSLSCGEARNEGSDSLGNDALSISRDTILVSSYTSRFEKLTYPVKTIGKIRSMKKSSFVFERPGILSTINVRNGEYVEKGRIIATLRNANELLQKENAEIGLKKALVNYENEMLALGDSIYYKENWVTVKENVQLNSGVLAAKVALKQAELAYQQTIIRAPFSGMVEGIELQPGDLASSSQQLGSIYDPFNYEVVCEVLEYDVMKIKQGVRVSIKLLSNSENTLKGTVNEINPAVNENGLSSIRIALTQSEGIIPGLSAQVEINITDEPSIVVPLRAVVKRSERHVVFNMDKGLAKWNYVTLGKDNGEKVQILEGLDEDMEIIISNNLQLAHDSPVRIN